MLRLRTSVTMSVSIHKQETLLRDLVLTTGFSKLVKKAMINGNKIKQGRTPTGLVQDNMLEIKGHIIRLIYSSIQLKRSRKSPLNCKYLQPLQ